VALTGLKLALAGLIIPYLFVYQPILLMENVEIGRLLWAMLSGGVGVWCLAVAAQKQWRSPVTTFEQICMFAAAVCLIDPGLVTDVFGALFLIVGGGHYLLRTRGTRTASA